MKFRHLPLLAAIFSTLIYAQTTTPPPKTPPNTTHKPKKTTQKKTKTKTSINSSF